MRIGLVIVGDEILSGRRSDKHLPKVVQLLSTRGLVLSWVKILGDEPDLLASAFRESFASDDVVFSTGGIGGTPDDLTRQAASEALGVPLARHPDGVELLIRNAQARNRELNPEHYRMVEFPESARLIPNPVNNIPGFSVGKHHFVPGFPEMAWPMIEWVLDNEYAGLGNMQYVEEALMVFNTYESAIIPLMEKVLAQWPSVKLFSLPIMSDEPPRIELGVKGCPIDVKEALAELKAGLRLVGATWERC